ncbi:hypothetical protein Bbelb_431840 [Branchiostoma belcheri]|nr:hypothetical protein Bbelb_431840 [Branchiostoma belcheri]
MGALISPCIAMWYRRVVAIIKFHRGLANLSDPISRTNNGDSAFLDKNKTSHPVTWARNTVRGSPSGEKLAKCQASDQKTRVDLNYDYTHATANNKRVMFSSDTINGAARVVVWCDPIRGVLYQDHHALARLPPPVQRRTDMRFCHFVNQIPGRLWVDSTLQAEVWVWDSSVFHSPHLKELPRGVLQTEGLDLSNLTCTVVDFRDSLAWRQMDEVTLTSDLPRLSS